METSELNEVAERRAFYISAPSVFLHGGVPGAPLTVDPIIAVPTKPGKLWAATKGLFMAKTRYDEWLEPATLTLDEHGMVRDCSKAGEELFGYSLRHVIMLHVSDLIPQLTGMMLLQDGELNLELARLCRRGHVFWAHNRYGDIFPTELSLVRIENQGARMLRLFVQLSAHTE